MKASESNGEGSFLSWSDGRSMFADFMTWINVKDGMPELSGMVGTCGEGLEDMRDAVATSNVNNDGENPNTLGTTGSINDIRDDDDIAEEPDLCESSKPATEDAEQIASTQSAKSVGMFSDFLTCASLKDGMPDLSGFVGTCGEGLEDMRKAMTTSNVKADREANLKDGMPDLSGFVGTIGQRLEDMRNAMAPSNLNADSEATLKGGMPDLSGFIGTCGKRLEDMRNSMATSNVTTDRENPNTLRLMGMNVGFEVVNVPVFVPTIRKNGSWGSEDQFFCATPNQNDELTDDLKDEPQPAADSVGYEI